MGRFSIRHYRVVTVFPHPPTWDRAGLEAVDTLEIPYSVRVELLTTGKQKEAGFTAVISWDHLDTLTTWAPSFQPQIDNAKADMAEDPTTSS